MTRPTVCHITDFIRPGGGPAGYLWLLRSAVTASGCPEVEVVSAYTSELREPVGAEDGRWVRSLAAVAPPRVLDFVWCRRELQRHWYGALRHWPPIPTPTTKVLVVHSPALATGMLRERGTSGDQRLFIMCHSPVELAKEVADGWALRTGRSRAPAATVEALAAVELATYERAHALLVPCKEAVSGYFSDHPALRRRFEALRFVELPTGASPPTVTEPAARVRMDLGLPTGSTVVGYFGRYHPHKGYDLFLETARLAMECGLPYVFLCAGVGPLGSMPKPGNVLDIGWRPDIGNVLQLVDCVMAPNRVTYFDLGLLEAMALGKAIVTTPVGGNVKLAESSPGVRLASSVTANALLNTVRSLCDDVEAIRLSSEANRAAYEREFSIPAFLQRHIDFALREGAG